MKLTRIGWFAAALLLLSLPAIAQAGSGARTDTPQRSVIGPGDVLEISVFDTPELESRVRVTDQGNIEMALIGAIHVSGLSPHDAEETIAKKLLDTGMVKHPTVNVFVTEFAYDRVAVLGEVRTPGTFPVVGQVRLLDVVSQAGGLLPSASGIVAISHRDAPDKPENFVLSDQSQATSVQNPPILPGDTIVARKAGIVYVVGGVMHPGGFVIELNQRLSLLKALALAEGPAPGASLGKAVLLTTVNGRRQEIPVDLKAMLHQKADDMQLQAEDILYVPVSEAKNALRSSVGMIAQAATYASVYHF